MIPHRYYSSCFVLFLLVLFTFSVSHSQSQSHWSTKKKRMREKVCKMFHHGYDNYMTHAFLHDELKPLTKISPIP
ncbi:Glycosyl hydrolase family 47 protein [Trifolium repens]|nr:Glycosyl hydrolase family 47 protein [Trifolium repens]